MSRREDLHRAHVAVERSISEWYALVPRDGLNVALVRELGFASNLLAEELKVQEDVVGPCDRPACNARLAAQDHRKDRYKRAFDAVVAALGMSSHSSILAVIDRASRAFEALEDRSGLRKPGLLERALTRFMGL